jgi:hypothetical protein
MKLITILNRCHRFRGFVYQHAHFTADKKSIEVAGYDQVAERRFEFPCGAQKQLPSGVVEGLNNEAKVTMRKSYSFRTFRSLELAPHHSLGKLPEPESTHEFF